MAKEGVLPIEDVWEGHEWWRYDRYYHMPGPDPKDKLGLVGTVFLHQRRGCIYKSSKSSLSS
jgi:hypothetical protein